MLSMEEGEGSAEEGGEGHAGTCGSSFTGLQTPNPFALLPSFFLALEASHLVVLAGLLFHWLIAHTVPYVTELFPYNAAGDSLAA